MSEVKGSKSMIMTLRVTIERGMYLEEDCMREIEIETDDTLLGLYFAIQKAVDFDNDHPFEFFYGRHPRNRKIVIEPESPMIDPLDYYSFHDAIPLSTIWPVPEKSVQLFYHFDFGDDWYFKIRKISRKDKEPEPKVKYPRVTTKQGPNPKQYPNLEE